MVCSLVELCVILLMKLNGTFFVKSITILFILDQKYRNINGTCNNLRSPKMGVVFGPLQRLIPNAYADGEFT